MLIKVQQNKQKDGTSQSREILLMFAVLGWGGGSSFSPFPQPTNVCIDLARLWGQIISYVFNISLSDLKSFHVISLIRSSSCVDGFSPAGTGQKSKKKEKRSIDFFYNTIAPGQSFR